MVSARNMSENIEKTIDIEKILKGKMGAKAKYVPPFLVNWLKRIVHQDQVNAFLWDSRDKTGTEWLEECVRYLDMTLIVKGKENLPDPADGNGGFTHFRDRDLEELARLHRSPVGEAKRPLFRRMLNDLLYYGRDREIFILTLIWV